MSDDEDVRLFYEAGLEAGRLAAGPGVLELARTQDVLERRLPPPPARVLDVGGGTGLYARWLAGRGYEVHLVDLSPRHIEEARAHAGPPLARAEVGDARRLADPDESADVVLLLGPLYHLVDRDDRVRALAEARRVVRPGGTVVAAAITRHASLLAGLFHGLVDDPAFLPILERDLREGQHRNPTSNLDYFTTAFFHLPAELGDEARDAGLAVEGLLAVEGPAWMMPDLEARWGDPPRRRQLMDLLRRIEADPAVLGMSAHLLLVARRA
ncbi:MAG TPA: class I SAM-dependent methyltransferase [Vicinamibacteria bacterium]|nr:class I SAM-dependent methyltransferase [Vicinamibacteria bacterium]